MKIAIKKINDEVVKATKRVKPLDNRPVKGAKLFDNMTGNVFISAKTNSGKTCTVAHIIEKCADRNTTVIAFCSTIYDDDSWAAIQEHCEKAKIPFIGHQSMINDDGVNEVTALLEQLKEEAKARDELEKQQKENGKKRRVKPLMLCDTDSEDEDEEDKPKKSKYQTPKYIIIFDDLAEEIKSKFLAQLLKKSRHYKMKVIVSSQYYLDCERGGRKQFFYYLIYGGTEEETLEKIRKDSGVPIPKETFLKLYLNATKEQYSFFYISRKGQYRKNFNQEYSITN